MIAALHLHLPGCIQTACAATQQATTVVRYAPGFFFGLYHGIIFPLAFLVSLFAPHISIYTVPNNGGWYNFGYFLGVVVFGVGARRGGRAVRRRR